MKKELCIHCHKAPVHLKRWKLCPTCYSYFRLTPEFDKWRNRSKEDKQQEKKQLLIDKYGQGLFDDLNNLESRPFLSLKRIGDTYGITRERVRQIYKHYYGKSIRDIERTNRMRNNDSGCPYDPIQKILAHEVQLTKDRTFLRAIVELELTLRCEEYNLSLEIVRGLKKRFIINDYETVMYAAETLSTTNRTHPDPMLYYKASVSENLNSVTYIVLGTVQSDKEKNDNITFYILPKSFWEGRKTIYIPLRPSKYPNFKNNLEDKIESFREAWDVFQ